MTEEIKKYVRVEWIHSHSDEPLFILGELGGEGQEIRKIEVFADGTMGFASSDEETPSTNTYLAVEPWPSITELARDPEFIPSLITKVEFEKLWAKRVPNTPD